MKIISILIIKTAIVLVMRILGIIAVFGIIGAKPLYGEYTESVYLLYVTPNYPSTAILI